MERQYVFFRTGRALALFGAGAIVTVVGLSVVAGLWPAQRWLHGLVIAVGSIASCWIAARVDRSAACRTARRRRRGEAKPGP